MWLNNSHVEVNITWMETLLYLQKFRFFFFKIFFCILAFIMIGQIRADRKQSGRERGAGLGSGKVLELGFELGMPVVQLQPGADWPLGALGRFPVAWRLIWPAALCFFFKLLLLLFYFFCLPNVPKWSFQIVAFPNKSIINHKSVSLDWQRHASRLFLASSNGFEQSRCAGLEEGDETTRRNS